MTVSSLTSVSAAPPVAAFSLSTRSASFRFTDIDMAQLCASSGAIASRQEAPGSGFPLASHATGVASWFRARRRGRPG
nr:MULTISPECIES: flavin reductase family protein [Mesorhizobium]